MRNGIEGIGLFLDCLLSYSNLFVYLDANTVLSSFLHLFEEKPEAGERTTQKD